MTGDPVAPTYGLEWLSPSIGCDSLNQVMSRDLLDSRVHDRSQLLAQIQKWLAGEPRACNAWLKGSGGRGQMDALSDLDVVVVVRDTDLNAIAGDPARPTGYHEVLGSARGRSVAAVADVLLLLEAPQNAPEGGKALTSFYAMPAGPQQVDWEWQIWPGDAGTDDTVSLLERGLLGRPRPAGPQFDHYRPSRAPADDYEVAQHAIPWFCATAIWNAKAVARSSAAAAPPPMLKAMNNAIADIGRYLGINLGAFNHAPPLGSESPFDILTQAVAVFENLLTEAPSFFDGVPETVGKQLRQFIRAATAFAGQGRLNR